MGRNLTMLWFNELLDVDLWPAYYTDYYVPAHRDETRNIFTLATNSLDSH